MPGYSGTHVGRARGTDCEAGQPVINVVIHCHLLLYSTTRYSKLWFPVDLGTATWISARVAGDSSLQYGEQTVRYGRRAAAGGRGGPPTRTCSSVAAGRGGAGVIQQHLSLLCLALSSSTRDTLPSVRAVPGFNPYLHRCTVINTWMLLLQLTAKLIASIVREGVALPSRSGRI
jgi:hypothetical protein